MKKEIIQVPLPEDILKLKHSGEFLLAKQMIQARLQNVLPSDLKQRLQYELEVLARIEEEFPYTKQQAFTLLQEEITDFSQEEFQQLFLEGAFEFYFIEHQMRFHRRFLKNLLRTRKKYALRSSKDETDNDYLNAMIEKIQKKQHLQRTYTIVTSVDIDHLKRDTTTRVWLPIALETGNCHQVQLLSASEGLQQVQTHSTSGLAYFETKNISHFEITYRFTSRVQYRTFQKELVCQPKVDLQPYLQQEKPAIIFTDYLKSLVYEVVQDETNPLIKAQRIYHFITSKIMYSFMRSYLTINQFLDFVATSLKGDCGLQALLFITMCRIAGVPAKWQSGLFVEKDGRNTAHDWAMFYVEPYGWLFADCSFGGDGYRWDDEKRREFYFGNIDPLRIVQTEQFMDDLTPINRFIRKDPFDNQLAEGEYEDGPISPKDFHFQSMTLQIEESE